MLINTINALSVVVIVVVVVMVGDGGQVGVGKVTCGDYTARIFLVGFLSVDDEATLGSVG